jgi:hypothetical protein
MTLPGKKQGKQCAYNIILRHVRKSLLPWKSNKYYIFVRACVRPRRVGVCMRVLSYSLAYPACKSYAPCCDVICGPFGSTIFFDMKGKIFEKELFNIKCVF